MGDRPSKEKKKTTSFALFFLLLLLYLLVAAGFLLLLPLAAPAAEKKWSGVDETVVEKFAEQAGHPARKPYINTDQGDILLFMFLLAGTIGGFIAGYYFRSLFPPKPKSQKESSSV